MAASFVAASTQYLLRTTAIVTAAPFTVGFWSKPTFTGNAGGNTIALEVAGTANDTNRYSFGYDGTPEWWIQAHNGTLDETDAVTGLVANTWQFYLARIISPTSRRIHILNADGTMTSAQGTVNITTPTNISRSAIGATASASLGLGTFDGDLGELWVMNGDIWNSDTVPHIGFVRWLAMYGPFALPSARGRIVEYRGLRNTLVGFDKGDTYWRGPQPVWTNVNGVIRNVHPPLVTARSSSILKNRPDITTEELLNLWIDAGGSSVVSGTAVFTGAGALDALGASIRGGTVAFSGAGAFAALGASIRGGLAAFTGSGTFAALGGTILSGSAAFTGTGVFAALGSTGSIAAGIVAFAGSGALSALGASIIGGSAAFTGTGDFNALGEGGAEVPEQPRVRGAGWGGVRAFDIPKTRRRKPKIKIEDGDEEYEIELPQPMDVEAKAADIQNMLSTMEEYDNDIEDLLLVH